MVTGVPVFFMRGVPGREARKKYSIACAQEEQRYADAVAAQQQACHDVILHLLNECVADMPIMKEWTPQQTAAAKALRRMAEAPAVPDDELLRHVRQLRSMPDRMRTLHLFRKSKKSKQESTHEPSNSAAS